MNDLSISQEEKWGREEREREKKEEKERDWGEAWGSGGAGGVGGKRTKKELGGRSELFYFPRNCSDFVGRCSVDLCKNAIIFHNSPSKSAFECFRCT
jgi:hypothetical protein